MDEATGAALGGVRRELERLGATLLDDPTGLLAYVVGDAEEGHFLVDPCEDGSWRIWSTGRGRAVLLSGSVTRNVLAVVAGECFLEAEAACCAELGRPLPLPVPPPWIRAKRMNDLAEHAVAEMVGGTLASTGQKGFDVVGGDGRRYQVKAGVRNPGSRLISTLRFPNDAAYLGHDELVHVEVSPHGYPVRCLAIDSEVFRSHVPNDGRTHQVEALLVEHGDDRTEELRSAFDRLFMI